MHQECNISLSVSKKIHVVFHNFQCYDLYLIFQVTRKYNFKINVLSKTIEKHMTFTIK